LEQNFNSLGNKNQWDIRSRIGALSLDFPAIGRQGKDAMMAEDAPPLVLPDKQVAMAAKANRDHMPLVFQDACGAAWITIDETNSIIARLNKPVFELDSEEAEAVFFMLFNSLSDVTCAVYTLSSGWIRPSVTALRGALETIATAVTVHHNPEKMVRYTSGKLEVPEDVITPAKQFFPDIGRLNGALTNQWTHETYDSTARSIHEASGKLLLVPNINSDWLPVYLNTFVEAAVLAQMVGIGLETCFPNLAGDEVHFAVDSSGHRSRTHARSDDAIQVAVHARNSVRK
jgi:hypothetical protein